MRRFFAVTFLTIAFLFVTIQPVSAKIDVTFSNPPTEIQAEQSFTLNVSLSGASESTPYYLRGVFYPENSNDYFGYTLNNAGVWHSSATEHQQFFQISGNQTTSIQFKPDIDSTYFQGAGDYSFKIGRYTSGGSVTWSDQIASVYLTENIASPTPTPSPSPTPTPSPSLSPSPSPTPTATPLPTTQLALSEIMPCPEDGNEWVEIKNNHDYAVTLESWLIRDETVTNKFPFSTTIPAQSLAVIELSTPILNNTNDTVKLLAANGTVLHQMTYTGCEGDQSYIYYQNTWQKTATPTKGFSNQLTLQTSPTPTATPAPTPRPTSTATPTHSPLRSSSPLPVRSASLTTLQSTPSAPLSNIPIATLSGQILGVHTKLNNTNATSEPFDPSFSNLDTEKSPHSLVAAWLTLFGGCLIYLGIGGFWLWKWYNKMYPLPSWPPYTVPS